MDAYISAIPFSGKESCLPMQSMSGWTNKPVHSVRMAKVGVAARPSQPAATPEAISLPPAQGSMSRRTTGDIDTSVMTVFVVATPPDALLVTPFGRAVEPLIGAPQNVQTARIGRIGVVDVAVFEHEGTHARPIAPVCGGVGAAGRGKLGDRRRWRRHVHRVAAECVVVFDAP